MWTIGTAVSLSFWDKQLLTAADSCVWTTINKWYDDDVNNNYIESNIKRWFAFLSVCIKFNILGEYCNKKITIAYEGFLLLPLRIGGVYLVNECCPKHSSVSTKVHWFLSQKREFLSTPLEEPQILHHDIYFCLEFWPMLESEGIQFSQQIIK